MVVVRKKKNTDNLTEIECDSLLVTPFGKHNNGLQ